MRLAITWLVLFLLLSLVLSIIGGALGGFGIGVVELAVLIALSGVLAYFIVRGRRALERERRPPA